MKFMGRTIHGITAWQFTKTKEKTAVYGAGSEPIDIASGNTSYEGSITIMGYELDKLNKAAQEAGYDDILEIPHELLSLTISMKKHVTSAVTVIAVRGIAFTSIPHAFNQADKTRSYQLPCVCMSVTSTTL